MRTKIGVLLPNSSLDLQQTICDVANEVDAEVVFAEGGFKQAVKSVKELIADHPDTVAIIARINSAAFLRKELDIPVVDLELTDFDFAKAITDNCHLNRSPLLLIQFNGSNKLYDAKGLSRVCGVRVETVLMDMDPTYDYSQVADAMGVQRIITSVSAVAIPCRKRGLEVITVPFPRENILHAFRQAISEGMQSKKREDQSKRLKASLDMFQEGLIATDEEGKITICNRSLSRILGIPACKILNMHQTKAMEAYPFLRDVFKAQDEDIIEFRGSQYAIGTLYIPATGLIGTMRSVASVPELQKKENALRRKLYEGSFQAEATFDNIISVDTAMKELLTSASRYAATSSNILITGESGTGKEILAQSIHNASPFGDGAFVAINCAALPETLLESELFGYEEGAFTGARRGGKPGLIELSHEGTLFLDEIGLLPMKLQAKLLRAIQERQICRLGGNSLIPIHNRLICATNENLAQLVQNGSFREDLFYRIDVLPLRIPPLRERGTDIIDLASNFIHKKCTEIGIPMTLQKEELIPLLEYDWPGNVRQLEAFVERFVVLLDENIPSAELLANLMRDLPHYIQHSPPQQVRIDSGLSPSRSSSALPADTTNRTSLRTMEEAAIRAAYEKHNGNLTKMREELGISRTTLWKKLKALNLSKER